MLTFKVFFPIPPGLVTDIMKQEEPTIEIQSLLETRRWQMMKKQADLWLVNMTTKVLNLHNF